MAEGFGKVILKDIAEVTSGGTDPKGVHPLAVQYMQEVGIDILGQTSQKYETEEVDSADLVVTLCGSANACVAKPEGRGNKFLHWDLRDPADAKEGEEKVVFRHVRDQIQDLIHGLLLKLQLEH